MRSVRLYQLVAVLLVLQSCLRPLRSFQRTPQPAPPDYSNERYWAALPEKYDSADFQLKEYGIIDNQKNAKADLFFIIPSNYVSGTKWNVSLDDSIANRETDTLFCRLLASAFNESCKIYVPRYRTAVLYSYFTPIKKNSKAAFDLAYQDVRNAFQYYLKYYNKGRPIVIASDSQGTDYAVRLLKEFFDNENSNGLKKQLVEAYLIGMPVYDTTFKVIKPSSYPTHTGGFVTWNSVTHHTNTFYGRPVGTIVGVNPLNWKMDTTHVAASENKGSLPMTANKIDMGVADAKLARSGFLWVSKPDRTELEYPDIHSFYYHKNDYLFFYANIRENVKVRVEQFLKERSKH
ncbi:MAG: DUF3089 domain-containing protein [Bacteroidota bacterium]